MQTSWTDQESKQARQVTSPLSLIITAFAPVGNIQRIWTPSLRRKEDLGIGETVLLMVDLAEGRKAMGGSALAQGMQNQSISFLDGNAFQFIPHVERGNPFLAS